MSDDVEEFQKVDFRKKPLAWQAFEDEVAEFAQLALQNGRWGIHKNAAQVRRKPAYFSKDRNSNIIFDVSIEVFAHGDFDTTPVLLWLIECKDLGQNVTVDDVEEFHSKMKQVGAHKGSIFTRVGFASGTIEFARTHRIGLSTLNKDEEVLLMASASGGFFRNYFINSSYSLRDDGSESPKTLQSLLEDELRPYEVGVSSVQWHLEPLAMEDLVPVQKRADSAAPE